MGIILKYRSFLIGSSILAFGVIGLVLMILLKDDPPRDAPVDRTPVIETILVESESGSLSVHSTGMVRSARVVNLAAEVPGQVMTVAPQFASGGVFRRGEVLLQIDPSAYRNAVDVAAADVAQRKLEVLLAQEEAAIARNEWDRLTQRYGTDGEPPTSELGSLVLREPQLRRSEAALVGAEARMRDAQDRLDRTEIKAPYNGRISTKSAEIGQYLGPGSVVASFYGTDAAEISVALTSQEVALLTDLFDRNRESPAIPVIVRSTFAPDGEAWEGYVARIEGTLDEQTRMLRIVVRVDAPYAVDTGRQPLLIGSLARVEIEGRHLDRFYSIPRKALREGNKVWISASGTLSIRNVSVVQIIEDRALIDGGLEAGDKVITTNLTIVVDGMRVRPVEAGDPVEPTVQREQQGSPMKQTRGVRDERNNHVDDSQ